MKRRGLLLIAILTMLLSVPSFAQDAKKPDAKVSAERREQIYKLQRDQARKVVEVQQALAHYKQLVAENDALVDQVANVISATIKEAGLDPGAWRLDVETMTLKPAAKSQAEANKAK
jgi:hypothetical protein